MDKEIVNLKNWLKEQQREGPELDPQEVLRFWLDLAGSRGVLPSDIEYPEVITMFCRALSRYGSDVTRR